MLPFLKKHKTGPLHTQSITYTFKQFYRYLVCAGARLDTRDTTSYPPEAVSTFRYSSAEAQCCSDIHRFLVGGAPGGRRFQGQHHPPPHKQLSQGKPGQGLGAPKPGGLGGSRLTDDRHLSSSYLLLIGKSPCTQIFPEPAPTPFPIKP